jgi:EpsI family protein
MLPLNKIRFESLENINGLIIGVGLLTLTAIYYPTVRGMFSVWLGGSSNYSHGLLLPFIIVYLLYKEWNDKGQIFHIYPRLYALLFIVILSIIWLFAYITHIQVITQLVFISIMATFLVGLCGYKNIGSLLFPILLLLTAVPIWTVFSEPLQIPTAYIVDKLLHITGYTSFREGHLIHIPEGTFKVSDVCSGVNNLIASVVLSMLLAYAHRLKLFGMSILIVSGACVAFLSNSIRIYIVVLSGHYTQMKHSLLDDHVWLGWVVFSAFYTLFLIFINKILKRMKAVEAGHEKNATDVESVKDARTMSIKAAVMLIAAASVGPALSVTINTLNAKNADKKQIELPLRAEGWRIVNHEVRDWEPIWINPDSTELERYLNEVGNYIDVYIAHYTTQAQNKEIINSENKAFDRNKWKIIYSSIVKKDGLKDATFEYMELLIRNKQGKERLLWQWYNVGGMRTVDEVEAKLLGFFAALTGSTDAAVFILSSEVVHNYSQTRVVLQEFVDSLGFEFEGGY